MEPHSQIQKVLSEGVEILLCFFCCFCLKLMGVEDPNTVIKGPSSASQRNAISMAFRWRADDGSTFNAGLKAL